MKSIKNNASLWQDIKSGGMKRQEAISQIYRDESLKNQVIAMVRKYSGSREQGVDVFHEGIIAMDAAIRKDKYRGEGSLSAYLFTICRFQWLNTLKRDRRTVYTSDITDVDQVQYQTPETVALEDEQKSVINDLLSTLGEKCKQILELWKLSYSMEEIATKVGLSNAGIARRQRYNCYQKLLKVIDERPQLKTLLTGK